LKFMKECFQSFRHTHRISPNDKREENGLIRRLILTERTTDLKKAHYDERNAYSK
jgi:hypothetical protein